MKKLNPCVTGDTKVWTVEGAKSFKDLADANEDVDVYCLDGDGNIKVSKMFHPRVTGYNIELVKITLDDGTVLKASSNHMFLTSEGYITAEDLFEGDDIITLKSNVSLPENIDEKDKPFTEYTGTKKGTVIKKCEVSGEEFECTWDEREVCTMEGYDTELYNNIKLENVCTSSDIYKYMTVKDVEFLDERENVYNGTVAVYHNYFTIDEKTNTIVNQLNCGE